MGVRLRQAGKCEEAGMRIKSEAVVLSWKPRECSLQVGNESLLEPGQYGFLGADADADIK